MHLLNQPWGPLNYSLKSPRISTLDFTQITYKIPRTTFEVSPNQHLRSPSTPNQTLKSTQIIYEVFCSSFYCSRSFVEQISLINLVDCILIFWSKPEKYAMKFTLRVQRLGYFCHWKSNKFYRLYTWRHNCEFVKWHFEFFVLNHHITRNNKVATLFITSLPYYYVLCLFTIIYHCISHCIYPL